MSALTTRARTPARMVSEYKVFLQPVGAPAPLLIGTVGHRDRVRDLVFRVATTPLARVTATMRSDGLDLAVVDCWLPSVGDVLARKWLEANWRPGQPLGLSLPASVELRGMGDE